ncbi:MAG: CofH family radical SAM protein [Cyanobacteriota bacterium]|nr:CofH family radical SAM protein [Cyanobacteriota bacterium]
MSATSAPPESCRAVDPEAWEIAADLLVDPERQDADPKPEAAGSLPSSGPLSAVLAEILRLNRQLLTDPGAPFPLARLLPLGRALMERSLDASGSDLVRQAADGWRRELVGDTVTYVVNRNLNASNLCALRCGFCAFRRSAGEAGAFRLSRSELRERAAEAHALGATELCLQAGLDAEARSEKGHLDFAVSLLSELREAAPGLHLHAFSPQELLFIAQRDQLPLQEVLHTLRQAGLGSVPGTAAEVLAPRVRRLICPEKLSARAWVAVIWQVHQAGLPSTSTMMAGHLETPLERLCHLCTLGAIQREAQRHGLPGFSEFILLPFVGASAPAPLRARVGRDQPDPRAMLLLTAQARLLLGPWIRHHQPSWVKLTLPVAAEALRWGCDDLGGTLMEEHITTMAGAAGGTRQSPEALQAAARGQQRPVRQRTTLYGASQACCPWS